MKKTIETIRRVRIETTDEQIKMHRVEANHLRSLLHRPELIHTLTLMEQGLYRQAVNVCKSKGVYPVFAVAIADGLLTNKPFIDIFAEAVAKADQAWVASRPNNVIPIKSPKKKTVDDPSPA